MRGTQRETAKVHFYLRWLLVMHVFVLNNKMFTGLLNGGLGDGGGGGLIERQGKGFLNQLAGRPRIGGLASATITPLIEVRVVNLVVN